MNRRHFTTLAALAPLAAAPPLAASAQGRKAPDTFDGLSRVRSRKLDEVYLLPGADFRPYTKVQMDPTEVAFRKNWQRDVSNSAMGLSGRISDADAKKIADKARTGFEQIFARAYADAGYQVVTAPGPDVLRVRTAVADLYIDAPERDNFAGMSATFAVEAGEATLIIEARDSQTGALLGRAVDNRVAGDMTRGRRNRITNESDFRMLFQTWAKASANGLDELKAISPIAG